jgi:hypothetical protein
LQNREPLILGDVPYFEKGLQNCVAAITPLAAL